MSALAIDIPTSQPNRSFPLPRFLPALPALAPVVAIAQAGLVDIACRTDHAFHVLGRPGLTFPESLPESPGR